MLTSEYKKMKTLSSFFKLAARVFLKCYNVKSHFKESQSLEKLDHLISFFYKLLSFAIIINIPRSSSADILFITNGFNQY